MPTVGVPKRARSRGGEGRLNQTPRNKLARPDHQKGKEEGRETASTRQRQCGVCDDTGLDGSDDDFCAVEISIARGVEETKDV